MRLTPERSEQIKARLLAAVEEALRARAISARQASLDVVGHDGLIRDLRAGRLPGLDRIEALFDYLGLELYLGPRRARSPAEGFGDPPAAFSGHAGSGDELVAVAWHPLAAPGAPGAGRAPLAFARDWLARAGLDPARLNAVAPEGEGTGVLALVDPRAPGRGGPAPWAFRHDGSVRLARLQFEAEVTVIFGGESADGVRLLVGAARQRIELLGRVVWTGRREAR